MTTRQSVAVHTRWGIPVGQKVPVITLRECISELFSLTKRPFEKYNFLLMFNTNHKYTLIHLTVIRGYSCRTFFFLLSLIGPKLRCSPPPQTHTHTHTSQTQGKFCQGQMVRCFLPKIGPTEFFSVVFTQITSMTQHRSPNTALHYISKPPVRTVKNVPSY